MLAGSNLKSCLGIGMIVGVLKKWDFRYQSVCVELGLPGFNEKSVGNIKNLYSVVDFFPTFVLFTKSKYM